MGVESPIIVVRRIGMISLEALAIIFGFAGIVVGSVLTYLFTKSHYEQKRKDDKADRDAARILQEKDKKIALAQEYLNVITEAATIIRDAETIALLSKNADLVKADVQKVVQLLKVPPNISLSIHLLNNPELANQGNEFRMLVGKEYQKMMELLISLRKKETIDENAINARIEDFNRKVANYSGLIQVILDKMSSELK